MAIRCANCEQENEDGSSFCVRCGARLDVEPGVDRLIGTVLAERYRILGVIGEGGMGRVYLAEQQLGPAVRKVAIKVLHAVHSHDEMLRGRFYRECEVVALLTHPNTVQFYDFGELADGRLYIVMEHIQGVSLADALKEGAMPLARVERLLGQIAGSLQEAHSHGVVHRDLKPENIMLSALGGEEDFAKVCDFGIAKRATHGESAKLTLQGTIVGTPQYMSPEQLTGGEVDSRSDIYSLGLILYEMLTGGPPFTARSPLEWAAKHTTAEPLPLESFAAAHALPEEKKRAVMRALAKLPEDRQQSARELAIEFLGRTTITTPPAMAVARPRAISSPTPEVRVDATAPTLHASPVVLRKRDLRPRRSRFALIGVLLGIVGIATGGAALWLLTRPTERPERRGRVRDVPITEPRVDAGPTHGSQPHPSVWVTAVQSVKNVDDANAAIGEPDGRFAIVHPQGKIVVQVGAGLYFGTDRGAGADLEILLDDARSGYYRVDVGSAPHRFTTVGSELVGTVPLDVDQFHIPRIRAVRIKNRGTSDLYVDAVGGFVVVRRAP